MGPCSRLSPWVILSKSNTLHVSVTPCLSGTIKLVFQHPGNHLVVVPSVWAEGFHRVVGATITELYCNQWINMSIYTDTGTNFRHSEAFKRILMIINQSLVLFTASRNNLASFVFAHLKINKTATLSSIRYDKQQWENTEDDNTMWWPRSTLYNPSKTKWRIVKTHGI